jgi:hypothetical protein
VALHGATNSTDWEEIQDAALDDLEQAALAGDLGYPNFVDAFALLQTTPTITGENEEEDGEEEEKELASPLTESNVAEAGAETSAGGEPAVAEASLSGPQCSDAAATRRRCTICGKTFSRQSLLNRHLKLHAGIRPFLCNVSTNSL